MKNLIITHRGEGINPIDLEVGKNLRALRTLKNYTQSELAKSVGITFQQLQKYETGANRISASKLQQLATVLKVDIRDFFGSTINRKSKTLTLEQAEFLETFNRVPKNLKPTAKSIVASMAQ